MTILLTGGAGYIATHTLVELAAAGHQVVVVDNYVNSQPEAIHRVEEIIGTKIPSYTLDVCGKEGLRQVFKMHDIQAVIHFAGLKAVGESVKIPLAYYRNNLDSTLTLCEVMQEFQVKRLVFSSSATVYGTQKKMPLVETMETSATNPYGWTKYMIEQILRDVVVADPAWSVMLLRYFNPIGAHESGRIGENPNGIPNNLMPYIAKVAAGEIPQLPVYGNDYPTRDGTCIRDYIHVVDLAKGHLKACEYAFTHTGLQTVNLGTGKGYSVLDIIHAFEAANHISVPFAVAPRRAGDMPECYADPTKAWELIGWKAEKSLEDMCRDTWRWKKNNPGGYSC